MRLQHVIILIGIAGSSSLLSSEVTASSNAASWSWESERNQSGELSVGSRSGQDITVPITSSLASFVNLPQDGGSKDSYPYAYILSGKVYIFSEQLGIWLDFSEQDFFDMFTYDAVLQPSDFRVISQNRHSKELVIGGINHRVTHGLYGHIKDPCIEHGSIGGGRRETIWGCTETGDDLTISRNYNQQCEIGGLGINLNNLLSATEIHSNAGTYLTSSNQATTNIHQHGLSIDVVTSCTSTVLARNNEYDPAISPYSQEVNYIYSWPSSQYVPFCNLSGQLQQAFSNYNGRQDLDVCVNGGEEIPSIQTTFAQENRGERRCYINDDGYNTCYNLQSDVVDFDINLNAKLGRDADVEIDISIPNETEGMSLEMVFFYNTFGNESDEIYIEATGGSVNTCPSETQDGQCLTQKTGGFNIFKNGSNNPLFLPANLPYFGVFSGRASAVDIKARYNDEYGILIMNGTVNSGNYIYTRNSITNLNTDSPAMVNAGGISNYIYLNNTPIIVNPRLK